ncbi:MAG: ribulose-phosphate 3-epimerase [Ruminococcus sp.]|nr:ribulose-phosphate 3-epimerase [Candidatus Copronaster equi]
MQMKISPSLMCADIEDIKQTLETFEKLSVEYLHIDIMDGNFVPNFMLGTDYCKHIRRLCKIPMDIHLMIEKPEEKISWFDFGVGDIVSVHCESTAHLHKAVSEIRKKGGKPFVAINPATPLNVLDYVLDDIDGVVIMSVNPGFAGQKIIPATIQKVTELRKTLDEKGYPEIEIEVDGNINYENARIMREAGANIFVVGTSSIFNKNTNLEDGVAKLREMIK